MQVIKRNGKSEKVSFDKITNRISVLCKKLDKKYVDPVVVAQKTIATIYNGITTKELDKQSAKICANMCTVHPDYGQLAANILISNLHKSTETDYEKVVEKLYNNYMNNVYPDTKQLKMVTEKVHVPLVSKELYDFVKKHSKELNKMLNYNRDYNYDFFGFQTLERAYLIKIKDIIIERPQHMLMRVAIGLYCRNTDKPLEYIKKTYDEMSLGLYTHATPTLYNCGTPRQQCSSCFVLGTSDDINGIFKTMSDCAKISKWAGGIGISISEIRAEGSLIRGTNGKSNGIIPMIKVYNEIARYIDQGGNKRKGAFALYLEPWHANIYEFINLKKNIGAETERARDIFLALWVPDLFMKRVEEDGVWSLMCPDTCKGLTNLYGDEFEKVYKFYEDNNMYVKQVKARQLFNEILIAQNETGVPYFLYKDAVNRKTNHQNIGVIKGSNLCSEIAIYFDESEYSVCTLASIALPKFVKISGNKVKYDYKKLAEVAGNVTRNLNRVIDVNYYPTPEAKISTMKHRPIGIGVQGLADTFALMKLPYDSEEAKQVNKKIFEAIYYGSLRMSADIAKKDGAYKLFKGSPFSKGILQFDMWNVKPSKKWPWKALKKDIQEFGTSNSLLTALMPTSSTSQILGNNEAFEPFTSNIYLRKTLAGNFMVVNKYLIKDLIELDLWNDTMKQMILYYKGSIQQIDEIPNSIKNLYKIASEIKQKVIVDLAIDRGAYIDQTQSMNLFMDHVDTNKLASSHFYSWKNGLKTGMYYLRSRPIVDAKQFTLDSELINKLNKKKNYVSKYLIDDSEDEHEQSPEDPVLICRRNNPENCEACSA
jgi:ribonucleoside-diphosphate reductase alpha subunit